MSETTNEGTYTKYYTSTVPRMDPDIKERWLGALRSGDYVQGNHALAEMVGNTIQYCCLGVLCETVRDDFNLTKRTRVDADIITIIFNNSSSYLPTDLSHSIGFLGNPNPTVATIIPQSQVEADYNAHINLAGLNDSSLTFDQIADVIDYFL